MHSKVPFFDLFIDDLELATAPNYIYEQAKLKSLEITSLNMDQFVLSQDDQAQALRIKNAEIVIADGAAISLISRLFFRTKLKKLAGIDLASKLIEKSKRLILIGASEDVINIIEAKFAEKIVFAHHGFFDFAQKQHIIEEMIKASPDLVLVAMGIPKQEIFIEEIKVKIDKCIFMGVGGSFDIWAEKLKRAPDWMIICGLEWFFRLIQEPSRLKRFFYKVRRFLLLLIVGGHRRGGSKE
ncbi:MAG: WecB/TagA/CpsF family glycosyltransferase [Cyanobacteria bacterium]|nr:WecB/TagA/CpsF family glycosyltransferase [Cyanobacteriota bacterium]MDA1021362.1 WecB/TagA/CpsF family glycosyltransferase [Cyanobacteriota bacterium]